jgi:hypothetical protein
MQKGSHMRVSLLAVLAAAFVLALGGTALAQTNPTTDAYGGVLGDEVSNDSGSGGGGAEAVANTSGADNGALPFTGSETALIVLAGIGLVALGFAMRRGVRRPAA